METHGRTMSMSNKTPGVHLDSASSGGIVEKKRTTRVPDSSASCQQVFILRKSSQCLANENCHNPDVMVSTQKLNGS